MGAEGASKPGGSEMVLRRDLLEMFFMEHCEPSRLRRSLSRLSAPCVRLGDDREMGRCSCIIGLQTIRRGARVVEWDGLENRCTLRGTVGSNPTPSAQGVQAQT